MGSSMAATPPRPSVKTSAHFQASSDFSIGTPLTESTPMLVIIGYIVAFGCIFGTYVLHGGNVQVILKALPFEMVTIGGGAPCAFIDRKSTRLNSSQLVISYAVSCLN